MNSKLYVLANVVILLLLTGCYKDKEKACKEYHKREARYSIYKAKDAVTNSAYNGYEKVCATGKNAYEVAKKKGGEVTQKVKNAACVVAGKTQELGSRAIQKVKNLRHKPKASHQPELEILHKVSAPISSEKEICGAGETEE
jgi:hypothetical protein